MSADAGVPGSTRRFTDREVAVVLRRATDLDERAEAPAGAGVGLTLEELREIARRSRDLGHRHRSRRRDARPAGVARVPFRGCARCAEGGCGWYRRRWDRDGLASLVATVDEYADGTGSVTEALGSVRWTARDRLKSTRVSFTPRGGETAIEVVEKAEPRLRRIFHLLPAAWGLMFAGAGIAASPGGPAVAGVVAAGAALLGAGAGRLVWTGLSAASERRVQRLAERLAQGATALPPQARSGSSPAVGDLAAARVTPIGAGGPKRRRTVAPRPSTSR